MPILLIPLLMRKAREPIPLHHFQIYIIIINLERLIQLMFQCPKTAVALQRWCDLEESRIRVSPTH